MSLLVPAEVKLLVQTSLSDADLQTIIDREEGWLAGRIGALSGSRTETIYPPRIDEHLHLRRFTSSVVIVDAGVAVDADDYRLLYSGSVVERIDTYWGDMVEVTSTPNDSAAVETAIIDLIRLRVTDTGYVSERIGQYSYQTAQAPGAREMTRAAIVKNLLPTLCPHHRSERIVASYSRGVTP